MEDLKSWLTHLTELTENTIPQNCRIYILLNCAGTITRTDHLLDHNTILNKFQMTKITQNVLWSQWK